MWIRTLDMDECVEVLEANRLGRLACAHDDQPYLVPFHYAYADGHLYAFSQPGKKVEWMRANPKVAVLVEDQAEGREWRSVIVEGRFEELPDRIGHKREREYARTLLSRHADWWEPGAHKPVPEQARMGYVFFRISADRLSGREGKAG